MAKTTLNEGSARENSSPALFDSDFMARLERMEVVARKLPRGTLRGEHHSRRRGTSLEFSDYRRYQPGDDLRYVDWNIFSRLDRLFLKLFAAEEDLTLHLLLDRSASMGFGNPSKFDYARRLSAALAYVATNRMDRVTVSAYATDVTALVEPIRSKRQMGTVLNALRDLACEGVTGHGTAFKEFVGQVRHPGIVVILGDLLGSDDVLTALRGLGARGHDIVVIQVLSEDDIEPPYGGPLRLVDAETEGALSVTVDAQLRGAYQSRLRLRLEHQEHGCRALGVEYLRASTAIAFDDVILRYLRQGRLFA
jgi:uncharacterized protein (DUF58 family)